MNRYPNQLIVFLFLVVFAASCTSGKKAGGQEEAGTMKDSTVITLKKLSPSPEFPDASLSLNKVKVEQTDSSYVANFDFKVENYEMAVVTSDAETKGIANSHHGQHIHFIVNNGPYFAHYEPVVSKEMEEGYYVILAFLSRSYHESVKNPKAYWLNVVKVGNPTEGPDFDAKAPHLFYSRPKGTYVGPDTEKLLLDFYLINTTISPDGNKVRATVNGTVFLIDEWAPYVLEGLGKGEVVIKLELIDKDGNLIDGPFNATERKVTLE